jgi:predicted metalloprotease with PDZ domain
MKFSSFALLMIFVPAASAAEVNYALTPLLTEDELTAVQVDLHFEGSAEGETHLELPDSWGGQQELWRELEDLQVVSGAEISDGKGPADRLLRHAPKSPIHLRYRVVQKWKEGPPSASDGNPYRPIIQPGYFHLIGNAALIVPEIDQAVSARMRVKDLPQGWRFASDLEHAGLTLGQVNASISVGGDYRILSDDPGGMRVAIRGDWKFADAEFLAGVATITRGHRRFWNDPDAPFLVTVTYLSTPDPGWTSLGGTGLDDAFAFFATPNAQVKTISRLLAHEGLHTWIPLRIGGMPDTDEAADYWLSEGFTDFYAARLLVNDGAWGPQQFADDLNETLAAYAISPAREYPNARVTTDFWKDQSVQKLPYQRGRLLATIWDARLRAAGTGDFDDIVHAMRQRAKAGSTLTSVGLFREVTQAMDLDAGDDLRQHIEAGVPIMLQADVLAPCGEILTRQVPNFHRGFDIEATTAQQNVVSGTDPDSPAYAAGMRDGMTLIRRASGEIGNAKVEIDYVVMDGDQQRNIRYLPRAKGEHSVQALRIDPELDAAGMAQCKRVLGGG